MHGIASTYALSQLPSPSTNKRSAIGKIDEKQTFNCHILCANFSPNSSTIVVTLSGSYMTLDIFFHWRKAPRFWFFFSYLRHELKEDVMILWRFESGVTNSKFQSVESLRENSLTQSIHYKFRIRRRSCIRCKQKTFSHYRSDEEASIAIRFTFFSSFFCIIAMYHPTCCWNLQKWR